VRRHEQSSNIDGFDDEVASQVRAGDGCFVTAAVVAAPQ
jgi:hypothetical protein